MQMGVACRATGPRLLISKKQKHCNQTKKWPMVILERHKPKAAQLVGNVDCNRGRRRPFGKVIASTTAAVAEAQS